MGGAGEGQSGRADWERGQRPIGVGGLMGGGAGQGNGPQRIGQPAPPPDWAGPLAAVGIITTGHYGVLVTRFLYIIDSLWDQL